MEGGMGLKLWKIKDREFTGQFSSVFKPSFKVTIDREY